MMVMGTQALPCKTKQTVCDYCICLMFALLMDKVRGCVCARAINRSREVRVIMQNGRLRQRLLSVYGGLSEARARITELEAMTQVRAWVERRRMNGDAARL